MAQWRAYLNVCLDVDMAQWRAYLNKVINLVVS